MTIQGYDLVCDIHGHADALRRLLHKLDYIEVEGVFRHPQRKMIFVGDFIDRGPRQREVLRIARSMCNGGAARAVVHAAIEILLKGPEERLPAGIHFFDKDGHKREEVRLRWWDHGATTFRKAALGMDGRENEIPDSKLPKDYRYHETKPVFFGHFWLEGQPKITAPNAACLDFSVAKAGYLTAYRWSGERELAEKSLVSVPS